MASVISAGTTSGTSLNLSGDTSGVLQLASNGSTTAVTISTGQQVQVNTAGTASAPVISKSDDTNTGIFFPAADTIAFAEGGAESMRIDSSGNVGIGTSSFTSGGKLVVKTSNAGYAAIEPTSSVENQIATGLRLHGNANETDRYVGIFCYNGAANNVNNMTFWTSSGGSSAERMRIASDGNIAVGATGTSGGRFTILQSNSLNTQYLVNSNATTVYGMQIYYSARTPNNTGEEFIYCGDTGQRFSARSNGGLANYSGNNVNLSDEREKTNIELAGNYLSKICSIPVKTFNYIDQNREEDDGLTLGVIAQDVQAVAPELVMESNWAGRNEPEKMRLGIYQTDLQYALMKAIQELKAELDATKAEVQALKGVA